MPVIGGTATPTVSVQVPVPSPVQSKKPRKSSVGPVSFGGEKDDTPPQPTGATGIPAAPRPNRNPRAVILPWSPPPQKMRRVQRYGRAEVDHAQFHNKIVENTQEDTPNLVYADYLEENGMPQLAAFIREVIRTRRDPHSWSGGRKANVLHVENVGPAGADGRPAEANTVFSYMGIGQFRERVGRRKPNPTVEVSVKSPSTTDPTGYIVHGLDTSPTEAHEWMKRLIAEGHPTGNESRSSALSRAANDVRRETPPEPPTQMRRLPKRVIKYSS